MASLELSFEGLSLGLASLRYPNCFTRGREVDQALMALMASDLGSLFSLFWQVREKYVCSRRLLEKNFRNSGVIVGLNPTRSSLPVTREYQQWAECGLVTELSYIVTTPVILVHRSIWSLAKWCWVKLQHLWSQSKRGIDPAEWHNMPLRNELISVQASSLKILSLLFLYTVLEPYFVPNL